MKRPSPRPGLPRRTTVSLRLNSIPAFGRVALRWACAWGGAGLIFGLLLMLGKAPPIAESGGKPDNVFFYFFWVPAVGAGAAAAGLGIGLVFACLMAVTGEWRDSLEGDDLLVTMGPDALCGFLAGSIAGLLIGGLGGAAFFGLLGAITATAFRWRGGVK